MKKFAVIVAGGSGQRMRSAVPKQFLLLKNKPILWHTINAFFEAFADIEIRLVLPAEHLEKGKEIAALFQQNNQIQLVQGGNTRFQSVKNGLAYTEADSIVFVHDGVRCLITPALIKLCMDQALIKGSAIPAVVATDSIRIAKNNDESVVADRNNVRIIQTPQTFQSNILLEAFKQEYSDSFTDEATVVEAYGKPVFLIDGEFSNIKITRPIDLLIAEKILEERSAF